jgi:general secretion pathway protein E
MTTSSTLPSAPPPGSTLNLRAICTALVEEGEIDQADAERVLSASLGSESRERHPLEIVAIAGLGSQKTDHKLTLNRLSDWLAHWAGQRYYHIDPLRIDAPGVAKVMSYAFAQRHGILAVEIFPEEVWIASAERKLSSIDYWPGRIPHCSSNSCQSRVWRTMASSSSCHKLFGFSCRYLWK